MTPNYEYLVAIGMEAVGPTPVPAESTTQARGGSGSQSQSQGGGGGGGDTPAGGGGGNGNGGGGPGAKPPHRMIIFDVNTKERKACVTFLSSLITAFGPRRSVVLPEVRACARRRRARARSRGLAAGIIRGKVAPCRDID